MMLINEMQELVNRMDRAISALIKRGTEYAQADHDYRVELAKEILMQKSRGTAATIMSDICRGKQEIADLRLKRDIAEVQYKSTIEAVNAWKLQIRVMESQIEREWGRTD